MGLKYRCEACGKGLVNPVMLKYHMSEHTGIYRFTYDVCKKGYNEQPQFEKHTKTHI